MVLMIKPFNKHIASLMVIELQLSSPNTICLNMSFSFSYMHLGKGGWWLIMGMVIRRLGGLGAWRPGYWGSKRLGIARWGLEACRLSSLN